VSIRVHIERLVVDAGIALDRRTLEASVIEGLSQALLEQAGSPLLQRDGSIEALQGGTIQFQGAASTWGAQLGRSVHAALDAGVRSTSSATKGPQ